MIVQWIPSLSSSLEIDTVIWNDTYFLTFMIEMLFQHWRFPLCMQIRFSMCASALLSCSCAHFLPFQTSPFFSKWLYLILGLCFWECSLCCCECLSGVVLQHLVNLFARLANDNIGYVDWTPYIPTVSQEQNCVQLCLWMYFIEDSWVLWVRWESALCVCRSSPGSCAVWTFQLGSVGWSHRSISPTMTLDTWFYGSQHFWYTVILQKIDLKTYIFMSASLLLQHDLYSCREDQETLHRSSWPAS